MPVNDYLLAILGILIILAGWTVFHSLTKRTPCPCCGSDFQSIDIAGPGSSREKAWVCPRCGYTKNMIRTRTRWSGPSLEGDYRPTGDALLDGFLTVLSLLRRIKNRTWRLAATFVFLGIVGVLVGLVIWFLVALGRGPLP